MFSYNYLQLITGLDIANKMFIIIFFFYYFLVCK